MSEDQSRPHSTSTLSTKVEEDFVSPLTSLRGALELLRDTPDLSESERRRFLETALRSCARLELGVKDLAKSVYSAGQKAMPSAAVGERRTSADEYASRVHILDAFDTIEIDFSEFEFSSSAIVNSFYDVIDKLVEETGRDWYFVVNYRDCSIWPEAWVAFAHRGKHVNVTHSLGTVRYVELAGTDDQSKPEFRSEHYDPNLFDSRDEALAKIQEMKLSKRDQRARQGVFAQS